MPTTYSVAIDFDIDSSFATAGDDVTSYVLMAHAQQGMIDEMARTANIGTLDLVLDNTSRVFSPLNASGPYYGKLLPMRPVRIQAFDGVTTTTIFRGFTRSFDPEPDAAGGLKRCTVQCEDILGILQRAKISLPLQTNKTMSELLLLIGAEAFKKAYATGTVRIDFMPSVNDTVTVGSTVYRFVDSLTQAYDVLRTDDPISHLAAAINLSERTVDGVEWYHANTQRHPSVNATLIGPNDGQTTTPFSENLGRTTYDLRAVAQRLAHAGTMDHVQININKASAPSDVTVRVVSPDANGKPTTTLVDANATLTLTAADIAAAAAWELVTFPGSFAYNINDFLQVYYTGAESTTNYYQIQARTKATTGGLWVLSYGGVWGDRVVGEVNDLAYWISGSITLTANARGTWGNSIALSTTGADIVVSGAALSGGTDGPDLRSYQTGRTTLPYAGDTWSEQETNAWQAMVEVVSNEPGLLWCARDGTLTAKDRQWVFAQTATAAALTLNNTQIDQVGNLDDERIANHIIVSYTPRGEETNQVVAQANYVIAVPGRSMTSRWTKNAGYTAGVKTVRLPFTIPDTGTLAGAKDIIHPVANTDYTVFDFADGSGFNYTTNGVLSISMVILGSGVEVTFSNIATGTLYVLGFQVRGTRLVTYETKEIVREDDTSIAIYGRRTRRFALSMATDENLATSYAEYLLGRYKNPAYIIKSETVQDANLLIGGVHPQSIEIGSVLAISETQTGVNAAKYLVQGIENTIQDAGQKASVAWHVRPLGDKTYWILGHATYGKLGSTTRLGI